MSHRTQPEGVVTLQTKLRRFDDWWTASDPGSSLSFTWLGQAGFAIRWAGHRLLIDPYLSDSLAEKYRGREFPHIRLMPPPVAAEDLQSIDAVLCTHRHSDHMDPGTLPVLARGNRGCQFVVPRAERKAALDMHLEPDQLITIDAEETCQLGNGLSVTAVPAAHETLDVDAAGAHRYLGYVLRQGSHALYHSGDTVPFAGLLQALEPHAIDLALLPVNGRDAFRRERGVPGNLTFDEAADLCQQLGIPVLVPHHFEMFAFNTVARETLSRQAEALPVSLHCVLPEVGVVMEITPDNS